MGNVPSPTIYDVDLSRPIGSWNTAWYTVCRKTGIPYRWHDLRHPFVSWLAANPNVSEETIRALTGHVSRRMLQRYSHIRVPGSAAGEQKPAGGSSLTD